MEKNIKILMENVPASEYNELHDVIGIIMKDRIQIIKHDMNFAIGLPCEEIPKERITKCINLLNKCAEKNRIDFHINEDWKSIEYFLRDSILDDLALEFKKQTSV